MIDIRNPLLLGLGAAVTALVVLAAVQYSRLQSERAAHAGTRTAHAQQLQRLADKATVAATAAVLAQQAHQRAVAAIDTQRTQERDHATQENVRLRAAVHAGTVRLRIAATCPARSADSGSLPGASAASRVDAETADLTPEAGQDVLDLRAALITERSQLLALQDYARACSAAGVPGSPPP